MSWHTGRMAAFDLETTSPNAEDARIVTACIVQVGASLPPQPATWIADPGIEVPDEAAAIHGYDTARVRAEGAPAAEVVEQLVAALGQIVLSGVPVVAMNARYDLTVMDREARRHGITPLVDTCGNDLRVIDPFVLDRQVDRYRKGRRTLTALCQHYRVRIDKAHDSAADAIAGARVAWRIGSVYPRLAALSVEELHALQITWAAEQAAGLQEHFRKTNPTAVVEPAWPMVPVPSIPAQRAGGDV
ncbi:3'-5' exonuclease [Streptomyces sp. NPDC051940]|uniref:3'-5' exonuclease n=1 Tax=Streptomyces sp. NPDC051940 TaxID=3155675 RepID=UPI003431957E